MIKSCILCGHVHLAGTPHVFEHLDQMADKIPAVQNHRSVSKLDSVNAEIERLQQLLEKEPRPVLKLRKHVDG
jgi:hypothetical protein